MTNTSKDIKHNPHQPMPDNEEVKQQIAELEQEIKRLKDLRTNTRLHFKNIMEKFR